MTISLSNRDDALDALLLLDAFGFEIGKDYEAYNHLPRSVTISGMTDLASRTIAGLEQMIARLRDQQP